MKKLMLIMLLAALTCAATAQTNFRDLSYAEALQAAKAENKMVFLDFYTVWCGPCKFMAEEVFPLKEVGECLNDRFVCIKIDGEKGEGVELVKRYKINAYPTFIGIDVNEKEVLRIEGYSAPDAFVNIIERVWDPEKAPERIKERYDKGERSAELVRTYASLLQQEARFGSFMERYQKARQVVEDYFNHLDEAGRLAPENTFIYTQYALDPADEKTRYMIAHQADFAPECRGEIKNALLGIYNRAIAEYLSGDVDWSAQAYEQIKNDIKVAGLNDDKAFDLAFQFIECYAVGDLNAYLKLCETKFEALSEEEQEAVLRGLIRLAKSEDQNVLTRASHFIRHELPKMTVNQLSSVIGSLKRIESNMVK